MDYDSILPSVGAFGRYQKLLVCAVLIPTVFPCAFQAYSQLFIAATPRHWCHIPELDPWVENFTNVVKDLSVPKIMLPNGKEAYDQCRMKNRNYTQLKEILPDIIRSGSISDNGEPYEIISCNRGWLYDKSLYPNTVVTEVRMNNL